MNKRKTKIMLCLMAGLCLAGPAQAQDNDRVDLTPHLHGTIRGKYEYQPDDHAGRFEVRNARLSVDGKVAAVVAYKAEIDLSDEGQIKMLDAYTRLTPIDRLQLTIGQMRVPFTIDAHRSPHQQYFANRSFIAKQVGNVRDVGARLGYTFNAGFPIVVEAGVYNGSGLTNQKDFWTNNINFSAKAQFLLPCGLNAVLSAQKVRPSDINIMMYDAGLTFHRSGFIAEAEYLYKHYANGAYHPVHAFDSFVSYDINLPRKGADGQAKYLFTKVSPLLRYDFMTDHSDGSLSAVVTADDGTRILKTTDYKRGRITGGVTLSLDKPFLSDIRVNYEKYFYGHDGVPKVSEKDKIVVELMVHF